MPTAESPAREQRAEASIQAGRAAETKREAAVEVKSATRAGVAASASPSADQAQEARPEARPPPLVPTIHLWMIDADGGAPRRLTPEAGDQVVPTWSHDGRWIYYSWWRADGRDIWRMPADGGAPERLTHGAAGPFARESADGKSLLFQTKDADSPLMTMALVGGSARELLACVKNSAFGVGSRGVYYVPCDPSPAPPLYVLDPNTGRSARLGRLDGLSERPLGLSVSPDGNTILYPRQILSRADLMLIENFK